MTPITSSRNENNLHDFYKYSNTKRSRWRQSSRSFYNSSPCPFERRLRFPPGTKPRTFAPARLHSSPIFVQALFVALVCFSITRGCDSLRYRRRRRWRLIQTQTRPGQVCSVSAFARFSAFPTVRKLTCLRGILRRSNIGREPRGREDPPPPLSPFAATFLCTVNAYGKSERKGELSIHKVPRSRHPHPLCISSEMKIFTLLYTPLGVFPGAKQPLIFFVHEIPIIMVRNEIVN